MLILLAMLLTSLYIPALGEGKITIVATTFPLYDWTRQVPEGASYLGIMEANLAVFSEALGAE